MSLKVAILAGGLATRLRPLTDEVPKSLVDVAGRPFVEHQLNLLRRHGLRDVVLCVGHLGPEIEKSLGDGSRYDMRLSFVSDGPRLLGTGGALKRALPLLGSSFLLMYGDSYLDCDYSAITRAFVSSGKLGLMTVFKNQDRWERSNVRMADGRIVEYIKNPTTAGFEHVDYGLGALRADAFANYLEDQPFGLEALYRDLLARNELAAYEVSDRFYEIGSFSGLQDTRELLLPGNKL